MIEFTFFSDSIFRIAFLFLLPNMFLRRVPKLLLYHKHL